MRFSELLEGLPGLASNLLSTRLERLQRSGLVEREGTRYALTEAGRRTEAVLWELAILGLEFPPDPDLRRPAHLRLAAVTLQNALRRVAPAKLTLRAELVLDGESFSVVGEPNQPITVRYGAPESPQVVARTSYEPMMAAAGGELPLSTFRAEHVELEGGARAIKTMRELMGKVMVTAFRAR